MHHEFFLHQLFRNYSWACPCLLLYGCLLLHELFLGILFEIFLPVEYIFRHQNAIFVQGSCMNMFDVFWILHFFTSVNVADFLPLLPLIRNAIFQHAYESWEDRKNFWVTAIFDLFFGCGLKDFNDEEIGVKRGKGWVFGLQFLNLGWWQFSFPVFECTLQHLVDSIGSLLFCTLFIFAPDSSVASSSDCSIASSRSLHLKY